MQTREIGGNSLSLWWGKVLGKIAKRYEVRSAKYISKGNKTIVSNPTCKFINPFTLLFSFTVNNVDKYQLVHEGEFTERYKEWRKKVDDYMVRKEEYDKDIEIYEKLKDKSGVEVPTIDTISDSPLGIDEMFLVILPNERKWFKKSKND